ncbi:PKD-like family lipoprotein [Sphingobacterium kitahiroshimense]|uniref:PKD-like family lipoprotein n=1 Tax=Sphingobacterium kitahiroshimense TaxID=470446 RepID=UPI003209FCC3
MKKNFKAILVMLLFTFSLQSCNKDLGNYSYSELSEIQFTGVDSVYQAYNQKELVIKPDIKFLDGAAFKADDYTFEWFTINPAANVLNADKKKFLGNQLNLDTTITLSPGEYDLYFRIQNKKNNYRYQHISKLSVTSELSNGWLVLNDIDGKARLDMLNYNSSQQKYVPYLDILSTFSNAQLEGKPKLVYYLHNRDPFNGKYSNRVYVGTDQMTLSFNNEIQTWTDYRNLRFEVNHPTSSTYHAEVIRSQNPFLCYILDSDGILMGENVTQNFLYGPTLNRVGGGVRLNISKYIAEFYGASSAYAVVFDQDNKRFLVHSGTNYTLLQPSSSQPEVFTPDQVGMDLLYMERGLTATNQFYALLKNSNTSQIKLLRFVHSSSTFTPLAFDVVNNTHQIDQATSYAVDPVFGSLIYTIGSQVYQYDPFGKKYTLLLDLGNRKISVLKYQKLLKNKVDPRYIDFSKKLMICSYDPSQPNTSGKMEFYEISLGGAAKLTESYTGFGKIADVSYRE